MRIRVLRDFSTANKDYHVGEVVDVSPRKAESWLRSGLVMEDKSLDGASETKEISSSTKWRRKIKR